LSSLFGLLNRLWDVLEKVFFGLFFWSLLLFHELLIGPCWKKDGSLCERALWFRCFWPSNVHDIPRLLLFLQVEVNQTLSRGMQYNLIVRKRGIPTPARRVSLHSGVVRMLIECSLRFSRETPQRNHHARAPVLHAQFIVEHFLVSVIYRIKWPVTSVHPKSLVIKFQLKGRTMDLPWLNGRPFIPPSLKPSFMILRVS
jgi:hypothetical protein